MGINKNGSRGIRLCPTDTKTLKIVVMSQALISGNFPTSFFEQFFFSEEHYLMTTV